MKTIKIGAAILLFTVIVCASAGTWLWTYRPGMDQYAAHRYAAPASATALTATWFGVTSVLLSDGEHSIFIDPFFTRPEGLLNLVLNRNIAPDEPRIRRWLAGAGVDRLDAVFVSHSHYDHAMDAGVVANVTGAMLVGSPSTANIGHGSGLSDTQIRVVRAGETMRFGSFTVTFIESRHAGATGGQPTGEITKPLTLPARYFDYRLGGTYSILVKHSQGEVLHHGSAGFAPGALKDHRADVVFLGVALIDDLDTYLREVVDTVGATRIIPTHWDDFTRSLDAPLSPLPVLVRLDRFFEGVERLRPQVRIETLNVSDRVALFPQATKGVLWSARLRRG